MVNTYRAAAWCEWAAKDLTLSTVDGGDEPQQSWPQQPDLFGHEGEKAEAEKGTQDIGMLLDEADADSGQSQENLGVLTTETRAEADNDGDQIMKDA
jgi:hypothetical protein